MNKIVKILLLGGFFLLSINIFCLSEDIVQILFPYSPSSFFYQKNNISKRNISIKKVFETGYRTKNGNYNSEFSTDFFEYKLSFPINEFESANLIILSGDFLVSLDSNNDLYSKNKTDGTGIEYTYKNPNGHEGNALFLTKRTPFTGTSKILFHESTDKRANDYLYQPLNNFFNNKLDFSGIIKTSDNRISWKSAWKNNYQIQVYSLKKTVKYKSNLTHFDNIFNKSRIESLETANDQKNTQFFINKRINKRYSVFAGKRSDSQSFLLEYDPLFSNPETEITHYSDIDYTNKISAYTVGLNLTMNNLTLTPGISKGKGSISLNSNISTPVLGKFLFLPLIHRAEGQINANYEFEAYTLNIEYKKRKLKINTLLDYSIIDQFNGYANGNFNLGAGIIRDNSEKPIESEDICVYRVLFDAKYKLRNNIDAELKFQGIIPLIKESNADFSSTTDSIEPTITPTPPSSDFEKKTTGGISLSIGVKYYY